MIVPEQPIKTVLESIIRSLEFESGPPSRITVGRYDEYHGVNGWRIRRWSGFLTLMPRDLVYVWDMRENEPIRGKVFYSIPSDYLHVRPLVYNAIDAYCKKEKIFFEEGTPPVQSRFRETLEIPVQRGDDCADLGSFDDM